MPTPYVTLICAPSIPTSEVPALKKHWQESQRDKNYSIVVNYECRIDLVELNEASTVLVVAPGLPLDELKKLREQVSTARTAEDKIERVVVCNYDARLDVIYNY